MTWVAVAVAGSAVIGGVVSSAGSKSAADAQKNAASSANQTQLAELQASAGLQTPGRNLGYGADSLLAQLYGIPDPNAANTTAGYAANSSLNAIGGLPGTLASTSYGTGATGATTPASTGGYSAFRGGTGTTNPSASGPGGTLGAGPPGMATIGGNPAAPGAPAAAPGASSNGPPANAPAGAGGQYAGFYNSPGYQFTLNQGLNAINRGASANGGLYSSNTLNSLGNYAEGAASTQYNNYVSQLMGLAGIGQGATNQTQSAATTAGNNISANQLSAGNANASGILGSTGAFNSAINNVGGAVGNYSALNGPTGSPGYATNGGYVYNGVTQNGGQGGGVGNIVGDF